MNTPDLNQNEIHDAALALVALNLMHPDFEDDEEYFNSLSQFWEEHKPTDAMQEAIQTEASKMEEFLSSEDPLIRALVAKPRTTAE